MRLTGMLLRAVEAHPWLRLLASPADIVLGPKTLVQPDLFVLRIDPAHPPRSWKDVGVPLLVIEVLSPSTAPRDRGAKRRIYQRAGVAEYWVVDCDAALIERWMPNDLRPEIIHTVLTWTVDGESLLEQPVASLFSG